MRITDKHLNAIANRINILTLSPTIERDNRGAKIGHYHISHAYGGVALHRTLSIGGSIRDVLCCGHVTKRHLQEMMFAFIEGIEAGLELSIKVDKLKTKKGKK